MNTTLSSTSTPRALSFFALAAAALIALSGCAGSSNTLTEAGNPLSVPVSVDSSGTDAVIELTVLSYEGSPVSDHSETISFSGDYENGYLYFVRYSAKVTEGFYAPEDTYPFSQYKWSAKSVGGQTVAVVNFGLGASLPDCKSPSDEQLAELSNGGEITACRAFVSASPDELSRVIYDAPRVGRGTGWRWTFDG